MSLRFFCAVFMVMLMYPATNLQAAEQIRVEIVLDGKRQDMSQETQSQIAVLLTKVFETCSLNSRDHPQIFASWDLAAIWNETRAKDYLTIEFSKPIEFHAGDSTLISAQQLLLGLGDPRFPGPELTRHGERVMAYVKCSGYDEIRFVCAPGIVHAMPSSYHGLCRYAVGSGQDRHRTGDSGPAVPEKRWR